jgi:hypothetical protein
MGPNYKRDNENDPESNEFISDHPFNGALTVDEFKNITIQWKDEENFEDGFIIKKAITKDSPLITLDTLKNSSTTYIDESKLLTLSTWYQIEAFVVRDDSLVIKDQLPLVLAFRPSNFQIQEVKENSSNLNITWGFESSVRRTPYFDGIFIEVRKSEHDVWMNYMRVDSTSHQLYPNFEIPKPDSLFDLDLRISTFIINPENEMDIVNSSFQELYINGIEEFQFKIIDEITGHLEWKIPTDKVEGYYLYDKNSELIDTLATTENSLNFHHYFPPDFYQFYLQPFTGKNKGKKIKSNSYLYHKMSSPQNINYKPLKDAIGEITWSHWTHLDIAPAGFIIYKKAEGDNKFTIIDTVDTEQRNYRVENLNPEYTHSYKITTYVSEPSDVITIQYGESLKNEIVTPHNIQHYRYILSPYKNRIVGIDRYGEELKVYDENYNFIQSIPLEGALEHSLNFSSNYRVYELTFNKDGTRMAFLTASNNNYYWETKVLHVFDLDSNNYLIKDFMELNYAKNLRFPTSNDDRIYLTNNRDFVEFIIRTKTISTIDLNNEISLSNSFEIFDDNQIILAQNEGLIKSNFQTQKLNYLEKADSHIRRIVGYDPDRSLLYYTKSNSLIEFDLVKNNYRTLLERDELYISNRFFYIQNSPYFYDGSSRLVNSETGYSFLVNLTSHNSGNNQIQPLYLKLNTSNKLEILSDESIHTFDITDDWSIK